MSLRSSLQRALILGQSGFKLPRFSRRRGQVVARYWRMASIVVIVPGNGFLEFTEVEWYTGATLRAVSTVASSIAPSPGSLTQLIDGSLSTTNRPVWNSSVSGSLWISFDLGAEYVIDGLRYANSQIDTSRGLGGFDVQWSTDNSSWTSIKTFSGLTSPGTGVFSSTLVVQ